MKKRSNLKEILHVFVSHTSDYVNVKFLSSSYTIFLFEYKKGFFLLKISSYLSLFLCFHLLFSLLLRVTWQHKAMNKETE